MIVRSPIAQQNKTKKKKSLNTFYSLNYFMGFSSGGVALLKDEFGV
jgi:hypothetical protein